MFNGKVPARETLLTFLEVCRVSPSDQREWLAAWQRARASGWHRPPGAARVRDVPPRELGVHGAIQERGAAGELPVYVPRDFDLGLRAAVAAGAERGCFVLLLGSSSAGKTRSAYEAVLACLPDWWLVRPKDASEIRAIEAGPVTHTVVWLDELQRYLGERGLAANTVRALRRAGAVVIGTMWPSDYLARMFDAGDRAASPDRELLDLAEVIDVADSLTVAEQRRAAELADGDSRIRVALAAGGTGLIQVLAAGPALVRWWEHSPDPYAKAVITAAADARRLGVQSPLTRGFLAAAAGGYLTDAQRAAAPDSWLDAALKYALTPLHGAATALTPVARGDCVPGQIAGYLVADYLLQHARRARRSACPPATCWQALADHASNPDDVRRAAGAAAARMRYRYAELLFRRLADNAGAASALAQLLTRQGRVDEAITVLRRPAVRKASFAARQLADLLLAQDRADEAITVLWPSEDSQHWYEAEQLIGLLNAQGRADEAVALLQARSDTGDFEAACRLAGLLAGQDRIDDAAAVLRGHSGSGCPPWELASLFYTAGRIDEAINVHRTRAEAGYEQSCRVLADLLAQQGHVEELWQRVRSGDQFAPWRLADLLADQNDAEGLAALLDICRTDPLLSLLVSQRLTAVLSDLGRAEDLRKLADSGNFSADYGLAETLIKQGRFQELRARAASGGKAAATRLAQYLERRGRIDEAMTVLRAWGDTTHNGSMLARLLVKSGRPDEAIDAARTAARAVDPEDVDQTAVSELDDLLAKHGRTEELRERVGDGDETAAWRLAELLQRQGSPDQAIDVFRAIADAGDEPAQGQLARLLAEHGYLDELRARADAGDEEAQDSLAKVLTSEGRLDELRVRARRDESSASVNLVSLLAAQGHVDELKELADSGDHDAAEHLLGLLTRQNNVTALQAEVDAGTKGAPQQLIAAFARHGTGARYGADHIQAFGFNADGSVFDPAPTPHQ